MSDNDLGDALLRFEAREQAYGPDVRQQITKVLTRDARRVKILAFLTIVAWLVGAALVLLVMILFALLMPFQAHIIERTKSGELREPQRTEYQYEAQKSFLITTCLTAFAVGVLSAASFGTVLLLFASRRALLRQVNANLLEISEQVKQLRQTPVTHPTQ
jgi:hypothetical protein